jgi:stearoyl-CoA desaturase (delta-9 desaturase)
MSGSRFERATPGAGALPAGLDAAVATDTRPRPQGPGAAGPGPEAPARRRPTPRDIEPCENERLDRFLTGTVTVLPFLAIGIAAWQAWSSVLHWSDVAVFAIMYVATGIGITVGYHRLFTHRSFKAGRRTRVALAILGSAAIEGPVVSWVADHRKHHAFTDVEGDPHSPHVDHGHGLGGALRGLAHAHLGWLFLHTQRGAKVRYAPDLLADPAIRRVDQLFFVWAIGGLVAPFALGWLIGGSLHTALTGLLWGGFVRMFLLHHVTYSINSLCHFFGGRRFRTPDESRNLAWLAPLSFGEAWHNNHHAFPTSARHGMSRWELAMDMGAGVIAVLERLGLAWDVVRISPERQARKAVRH